MTWVWLRRDTLLAIHNEQLAEHGGAAGLRDEGLFESGMARAENLAAYGEPSAFELAASYAFGIIRNHPFIDGNKRTGLIASVLFLELNGYRFDTGEADVVEQTLSAAAGELSEAYFARWLQAVSRRL